MNLIRNLKSAIGKNQNMRQLGFEPGSIASSTYVLAQNKIPL